jgi:hypothetical protein
VKENSIPSLLRRNWPPAVLMERIENTSGSGTGDMNCCYLGNEFWLELKLLDSKGRFEIRPSQIAWHARRRAAGSKAFVLARSENMLQLSAMQDDLTWKEIYRTSKPFDYATLLSRILTYRVSE